MTTDTISEQLYSWLTEAVELRFGPAQDPAGKLVFPSYEEGPRPFIDVLVRARQRADRIEELLSKAKRVRARLAAAQRDAAEAAEDKFDLSIVNGKKVEFATGMEKKAEASLESFEEKRAERLAAKRLAVATEVVEALNDLHWGLSGVRAELRDIVRSYQLESNLER